MESGRTEHGGRVARNTTLLTVALVGQKLLSFLYILILARLIGTSSTGDFLSSLSFIGLFSVLIDLGLTPALIRETARDHSQGELDLRNIIGFKLLTSLIVGGGLIATVVFLRSIDRFSTEIVFLQIAAIVMIFDQFVITIYAYFRGIERLEYESLGIILHRVSIMLVGIISLSFGSPPIWSMLALLTGSIVNVFYVSFQLWKRHIRWWPKFEWPTIKRLLRISSPFAVASLFIAIYSSSDNILLQMFGERSDVGLYGTSAKVIAAFTQIFPAALVASIFPAMSATFVADQAKMRTIFRDAMSYLMIIAIPLTVVLILLAEPIMIAGWGTFWADAVWPLRVLALGIPFLFLNYPVGYLLNSTNRQTQNTINVAITVVVNIAANLVFIESYSYHSVAIISVASSVLLFLLGIWRVRRVIPFPTRELFHTMWRSIVIGCIVTLVGTLMLREFSGLRGAIIVGLVMGVIYVLSLFAFRLVTWAHLKRIIAKFRRA